MAESELSALMTRIDARARSLRVVNTEIQHGAKDELLRDLGRLRKAMGGSIAPPVHAISAREPRSRHLRGR